MNKLKYFDEFLYEFNLTSNPIKDIHDYINNMNKGLTDKLFFFNKIDISTLVDFGSADGTLLKEIHKARVVKFIVN